MLVAVVAAAVVVAFKMVNNILPLMVVEIYLFFLFFILLNSGEKCQWNNAHRIRVTPLTVPPATTTEY